ncbi:hypothetical protein PCANC_12125 [Puccinia coronata f. sp. avenae]|uniref:Phospholipid scramblase n=1 Tax=Puccinia coronata f. sp. avenae TaxID=200324 RepID=A0A2N5UWV7_9BASI|nr:hypothetical protein PCANC_12125 [Puccinia coronata f. sp. avenae]
MVLADGGEGLAKSSRTNSSVVRTFSIQREVSITNRDFLVGEMYGTEDLSVQTRLDRPGFFQMTVEPDINPDQERCGHEQKYRTSDGVDYLVDPRGWATDQWTIKGGEILGQDYHWKRKSLGLAGPIKDELGRHVAQFHAQTWGQEWVTMLWHSKAPHATTYIIETNDDIPIEYLVGLFTVAIVRMDKCGR